MAGPLQTRFNVAAAQLDGWLATPVTLPPPPQDQWDLWHPPQATIERHAALLYWVGVPLVAGLGLLLAGWSHG
jgi:hypothetical protein